MRATATEWAPERPPEPGDVLATDHGSIYLVTDVRPGRINPWVMDVDPVHGAHAEALLADEDVTVWSWRWNPRKARGAGRG